MNRLTSLYQLDLSHICLKRMNKDLEPHEILGLHKESPFRPNIWTLVRSRQIGMTD